MTVLKMVLLRFKEFHGLQDDLKFYKKYPVQKPKKRRHIFRLPEFSEF